MPIIIKDSYLFTIVATFPLIVLSFSLKDTINKMLRTTNVFDLFCLRNVEINSTYCTLLSRKLRLQIKCLFLVCFKNNTLNKIKISKLIITF